MIDSNEQVLGYISAADLRRARALDADQQLEAGVRRRCEEMIGDAAAGWRHVDLFQAGTHPDC